MDKLKELRMTLVILVIGTFFISGCFFNNKHTVTFKTNGGSEIKNISVKNGSKLEDVEEPKKDGYVFDGWYLEGEEFDFNTKIDEDMTLVAKWVKVEITDEKTLEIEPTTTSTTKNTKITKKASTTKSVNPRKTTKKATKKANNKTTKKTTSTSTSQTIANTVKTTNASTSTIQEPTTPTVNVDITVPPVIEPTTEPTTQTTEPITKTINLRIEKVTEQVVKDEATNDIEEIEIVKITKTTEETNVISNITTDDLKSIIESDMKNWIIVSGNGYKYVFNFTVGEEVTTLELKGDNNVHSLTVQINNKAYLFNYDEVENKWYIQYPTVSVGTSTLDIRYFNDLQKALNNAKKGEHVTLLSDIEVVDKVKIPLPIIFDGEGYTITKKSDYLFDIENMVYEPGDELIFDNMSLNIESLIYKGTSNFDNITINASVGIVNGVTIDKFPQLTLNNSIFYSKF